ncbi:MAG: HAMP domain-containing protein, partial [Thermoplasmata archaeon]|nr:HAMP domain-containing protein [Thermoplasmata archaeon]
MLIKTRITVGFTVMLLLLSVLIASMALLGTELDELREKLDDRQEEYRAANSLLIVLHEQHNLQIIHITTGNSTMRAQLLSENAQLNIEKDGLIIELEDYLEHDDAIFPTFENIVLEMEQIEILFDDIVDNHTQLQTDEDQIGSLTSLLDRVISGSGANDEEGFDYLIEYIRAEIDGIRDSEEGARHMLPLMVAPIVISSLILAVMMRILLQKTLVKPINNLIDIAKKVVYDNELDTPINIHSKDEIGELAEMYRRLINTTKNAILILEQQE